jgi:cell division protease FtsH
MSSTPKGFGMRNKKVERPTPPAGTPPPGPRLGSPFVWLLVAAIGFLFMRGLFEDVGSRRVPYSDFKEIVRTQPVERVVLSPTTAKATLGKATGSEATADGRAVITNRVPPDDDLIKTLNDRKITYEAVSDSGLLNMLLAWVLPLGLVFVFWSYMFRRTAMNVGQGPPGVMSFGKSRARVYVEQNTGITFADVAGVDEAADELKEIVEFLRTPEKFRRLGGKIPKGVLLVGPPGTGKTLLAKAVAGEANVPFFSLSGSEFVEMFVGVGAARVRDLFAQAGAKAPCIVFIDELDAIGKARNAGVVSGHDEREQTLNQLLAEMDGFDARNGLIVVAATNRPETLDPALMRPGRFDRHVLVDRPDKRGREKILEIHARDVKLGPDVKLREIATHTPGFAGADLANIVNEAALLAGRAAREFVTMADFNEAIERVTAGLEKKNRRINDKEKEIVAYHESGHALVSTLLPHADQVHKVSIIPRGLSALGYTRQMPLDDRYLMSTEELRDKIAALFGGRAAEEEIVGSVSTGAANDVRQATEIARLMVCEYGMSEKVGPLSLLDGNRNQFLVNGMPAPATTAFSEQTARVIDSEVAHLVTEGLERARAVVRHNRIYLEKLAARLLTIESIDGDEVRELLRGAVVPPEATTGSLLTLHPVHETEGREEHH